jgi:bifunctional UDP-N-acetylglucosamine pyrophosphorylase/glucosamine-1-phosphate N-acetyltransferase
LDLHVVVLAAGKGTRMKSQRPKVLHEIAGLPLIDHVLRAASALAPQSVTLVVGHQAETVRAALASHPDLTFVVQEPQLGTAHALLTTEPVLASKQGTVVLLSGDVPLLTSKTLKTLVDHHERTGAAGTLVTAIVDRPQGYGRVVRSGERIAKIVEHKDATEIEREIHEINAGVYAFGLAGLFDAVRAIAAENAQREYYLPDLVSIFLQEGRTVETICVDAPEEILGINSREELAMVNRSVWQAKNQELMAAGVTIEDPATTYIHQDVEVGADTILRPGVSLERGTRIGAGCDIHSGARIVSSTIGDGSAVLNHSVITGSTLGAGVTVGPFAHLRNGAVLRDRSKVGNFVEVKNTSLGEGSKSMHLAYLGDAVIGARVNVGAGTITCNYDGVRKQTTTIEDGAFIGSDTQLIAPVTVGKDAYVGTGTTVRADVPGGALAVSAGKQRNIDGWVEQRRKKLEG